MEQYSFEKQPVKQVRYAGFWIRFAAYLLDSIIVGIPMTIIMIVLFIFSFGSLDGMSDPSVMEDGITDQQAVSFIITYLIIVVLSLIVTVAYFAGMHSSKWQATVGKKLLKLKVTDLQGNRVSFWRAFGRLAAMGFLSGIFYIGYIITAFTEKKQSLHDLIAGTIVVQED